MTLEGFRLLPTTASLVFSVVVLVVTAALCLAAWHRSGYTMKIGLLEGLRFLVVIAVVFTLNQPEWVFQEKPREPAGGGGPVGRLGQHADARRDGGP
jgi:hypothetical protein